MSEIQECFCFKWKGKPFHRNSSDFSLYGFEWNLEFKTNTHHYWLELSVWNSERVFRPLKVTCFSTNKPFTETMFTDFRSVRTYNIWKATPNSDFKCRTAEIEFFIIFQRVEELTAEDWGILESNKFTDAKVQTTASLDLASLSSDFGNLLTSGEASDVQLRCEGFARPAHRSVLAARSEVFSAMFRNKMAESASGVVDIQDLDLALLDLLLEYIYTGKLSDIPSGRALELYAVADRYAVHNLKKTCAGSMIENLSEDNYRASLLTADNHGDENLKNALTSSIINHSKWLDCEAWHTFSEEHSKLAIEVYRKLCDKTCFHKFN